MDINWVFVISAIFASAIGATLGTNFGAYLARRSEAKKATISHEHQWKCPRGGCLFHVSADASDWVDLVRENHIRYHQDVHGNYLGEDS